MYFRFHGRIRLFASNYTKEDLAEEARKIRRFLHEGHDVYAYFNNANVQMLSEMMRQVGEGEVCQLSTANSCMDGPSCSVGL